MSAWLRHRWLFPAACLLALGTILTAYSNSFHNAFHFDDSHVVENNLYIRNIGNLPLFFQNAETFSSLPANATYRPLVTATLAIDYWIGGGLAPRQFHVSQLVCLLMLAGMEFLLFRALFDAADPCPANQFLALTAATLCAVHTTTTETMNMINARSELLSVMGIVGSFLLYLLVPATRRFHLYLLPTVMGALAKNQAVVFGPLFLVYVLFFEQHLALSDLFGWRSLPRVLAAIGKALPSLVAGVVLLVWVESMNAATATYGGGSPSEYLRTQFWVWLHYGRLFLVPYGLTADTDWTLIPTWYDWRIFAGVIFVALIVVTVWISSRVASLAPVAFGVTWFALALCPSSSVIPIAEVANEHRVFFPYVGLSMALVWSIAQGIRQWSKANPRSGLIMTRGAVVLALVAISGNAVGTYERNKAWRTEETLWRDVTEKSPANGRGWMNYGLTLMGQGKYEEARLLFERATIYTPNYSVLEVNLGIVTSRLGELDRAQAHFARALLLNPNTPSSYSSYARWLVERGRLDEAIPLLERAVALSPALADARYQLMNAYYQAGQSRQLKNMAEQMVAVAPQDAIAKTYLGDGRRTAADAEPATASTAEELINLSLARYRRNDFHGCIEAARQALKMKPDYPEAHNNIAAGLASLERWDEAIEAAREALRLRPDFPLARNNLAWAESRQSK